jgi:hypothetical protein
MRVALCIVVSLNETYTSVELLYSAGSSADLTFCCVALYI